MDRISAKSKNGLFGSRSFKLSVEILKLLLIFILSYYSWHVFSSQSHCYFNDLYLLVMWSLKMSEIYHRLYQEKNRRPSHPRWHVVQTAFTVRNPTRRNFLFFSQCEHKRHCGRVRENTTHLSSYMKTSLSCSY